MAWVDIAENVRSIADIEGKIILNTWILATRNFDEAYQNSPPLANIAGRTLGQAADSFVLLQYHVKNSGLAKFFNETADSFLTVLGTGGTTEINDYMVNRYPTFQQQICNRDKNLDYQRS